MVNAAWGELFLEKDEADAGAEVLQVALKSDETNVAALDRSRQSAGRAEPAEREGGHRAGAENQSELRSGASVCRRNRPRRPTARRRTGSIQTRAEGQSEQPRGAVAAGGDGVHSGKDAEFERLAQDVLKINPDLRRRLSHRRQSACESIPVRRSGGDDAPCADDRSEEHARACRPRPAADAGR